MKFQRPFRWLLLLTVGLTLSANHDPAKLTFDERVRAQGAIERFYFERRTGSDRTFEEAVPRSVLERKVEDYLSRSLLLEQRWGVEVTAKALRDETERMARSTRDPLSLRQLFEALDNDPVLIQECLARQRLVQRWAREQFEAESDSKTAWDEWWDGVRPEVDRAANIAVQGLDDRPITSAVELLGVTEFDYEWVPSQLETELTSNVVIWTGAEMLMWGGALEYQPSDLGQIYDPVTDSMTAMTTTNAPSLRWGHTAVWTGTEMIVWGGNEAIHGGGVDLSDGARYNPATGSWHPLSSVDAPWGRWDHTAVWTGNRMIVFGGSNFDYAGSSDIICEYDDAMNHGAEYDPASDTWVALPFEGAPTVRAKHTAIWTGNEMIVWGGAHGNPVIPLPGGTGHSCNDDDLRSDGAVYDPVLRRWTLVELPGSQPRYGHRAVWTGLEMLVYGLRPDSRVQPDPTGFRYDPSTGSSSAISPLGQPTPGATVWNGREMIVFRGAWGPNQSTGPGARYDPGSDTWTDLPLANMPPGRQNFGAVWTGSSMLISGGRFSTSHGGGYLRATPTDGDGDGIPRESDNCPTVANAGQEDIDADGVGDLCDNCPVDSNSDQVDREADGTGDLCDNCLDLPNPDQLNSDGDSLGDACDNCPSVRNDSQADSDLELIAQWASSATASSEWSPTDWSAAQATGPPEGSDCGSAPTNWSPLGGGVEPEWLELTYATPVAATGVRLRLAAGAGFITRVELRDVGGGLHTVWSGVDTNICGEQFYRTWDSTAYLVESVIVHTAYDGWEEIDAVQLIGVGGPLPDQIGDACDVCPSITEAPSDLDGDGVFDACDCDPYDPSARLPREVGTVVVSPAAQRAARITWPYNGFVDAYSVARVLLSELGPGEYGQCIASGISGSSYTAGETPPAGDGFGYLVRGNDNVCGAGSLGADSSGRLREDPDSEVCP